MFSSTGDENVTLVTYMMRTHGPKPRSLAVPASGGVEKRHISPTGVQIRGAGQDQRCVLLLKGSLQHVPTKRNIAEIQGIL